MAIGLFLVGIGYLRKGFSNREEWSTEDFGKRLLLLSGVLMFSLYVVSSYQVGLSLTDGEIAAGTIVPLTVKLKVLLFGPLELLLAVIEGTMFLVLGVDDSSSLSAADELPPVAKKVERLFKITCLWHTVVIVWWLLWLGTDYFSGLSVLQHTVFGCFHGVAAGLWTRRVPERSRARHEWVAVGAYTTIVTLLYFARMSFYISRTAAEGS